MLTAVAAASAGGPYMGAVDVGGVLDGLARSGDNGHMATYPGGKGLIFRHIINEMPPHRMFVDLFAGGGAVLANKRPALVNVAVDLDGRALQDLAEQLPAGIVAFDEAAVSSALAMLASVPSTSSTLAVSAERRELAYFYLQVDALELLAAFPWRGDELVYADPPYLLETRRQKRDLYRHEFGDEEQHSRLLKLLCGLPCRVMVSGYSSALYDEILSDWRSIQIETRTRGGSPATEWLWMNYAEPERLHDYSWLGDDYRERERIKRKAARWVRRFERLPVLERRAIWAALREAGFDVGG